MPQLKHPANFAQDENGRWWYHTPKTGRRASAEVRDCEYCGDTHVTRTAKVRGIKARFCSRVCANRATVRKGVDSPRWKGGRFQTSDGYVKVLDPRRGSDGQVYSNNNVYVLEHRLVMEETLGRELLSGEEVHHKNGVRSDNRASNLELWSKSHPAGQRVEDLVDWAKELLSTYEPEALVTTSGVLKIAAA